MLKVHEVFEYEVSNGIFATMQSLYSDLYADIFAGIEPATLDNSLLATCGERYAAPIMSYPIGLVTAQIVARYGESWKRVKAALSAEYDAITPTLKTRQTTQERRQESDRSDTTRDTDSAATFDSAEPVETTSGATQSESTTSGVETLTTTITDAGLGNTSPQALIRKELEIRQVTLMSLVIGDVKNMIALDLY